MFEAHHVAVLNVAKNPIFIEKDTLEMALTRFTASREKRSDNATYILAHARTYVCLVWFHTFLLQIFLYTVYNIINIPQIIEMKAA